MTDGGTFETSSPKHPVRLAGADTPEKGDRGFGAAKQVLNQLVDGRTVEIDTVARDACGRAVAKVKVGRTSVNRAMKKHE